VHEKKLFLKINFREWNDFESGRVLFPITIKEGGMYLFYPLALLAGIGFYFMMNYVDQDDQLKTVKVRQTL